MAKSVKRKTGIRHSETEHLLSTGANKKRKTLQSIKKKPVITATGNRKKRKISTPEFKIIRKRLKEAIKVKSSGTYRHQDFDKLIDSV